MYKRYTGPQLTYKHKNIPIEAHAYTLSMIYLDSIWEKSLHMVDNWEFEVKVAAHCITNCNILTTSMGDFRQNSLISLQELLESSLCPDLGVRLYLKINKPTVINRVWYQWRNRQIDQRYRTENPEIDSYKYSQQIFDKGTKAIQRSKNSVFNKWCWDNLIPKHKKINLDLIFFTIIISRWMIDLNANGKL